MRTLRMLVLAALLLAPTLAAVADDWPQWRGPAGDGISTETNLATRWPEGGPKQLWRIPVGAGYSSPIAVKGVVYLFCQQDKTETLLALDAKTGRPVRPPRTYPTTFRDRYPGTRATPVIDGGRAYTFGGAGDLVCWNLADGTVVWRTNILKQTGSKKITWGSSSTPLLDDNQVIVQAGKGGPTAVACDKRNGKILWRSQSTSTAGYAPIVAVEVDDRRQLLVFGGAEIVAMDPATGQTLWSEPHETNYQVNAATPIVRDGKAFFTNEYKKGKSTLIELKPAGKTVLQQTPGLRSRFATPILDGDTLYMSNRGKVTALRWPQLTTLWTCDDKRLNLGTGGSMVRCGELLITLSERGALSLMKATPEGFEFRGQVKLFGGKTNWSTPLIYNGRLYVKGDKELACFDITGK